MRLRRLEQKPPTEIYDQGELIIAKQVKIRSPRKKRIWIIVFVVIAATWLILYFLKKGRFETIGTLSIPVVEISPRTNSEILSIHCREGQAVSKGDTLTILREHGTIARSVVDTNAILNSDRLLKEEILQVNLTLKELHRKERLFSLDLIVSQEVEKARAEYQLALARLEKRRAELIQKLLTETRQVENPVISLKAPTTGVIGKTLKLPGEVARAGEPILTLLDTQHPWIQTTVPEQFIERIYVGQPVLLKPVMEGATEFVGHVQNIGALVDIVADPYTNGSATPERGVTIKIFAPVNELNNIKPGSSIAVKFR